MLQIVIILRKFMIFTKGIRVFSFKDHVLNF